MATTMANPSSGRRILLLGAGGQVGQALRRSLTSLGDVLPATRRGEFGWTADLGDLPSLAATVALIHQVQPSAIVNAAAYTAVDRAESEPEAAALVNTEAPRQLAVAAAKLGIPLVHFSTDYVFPGTGTTPWREDAQAAPLNVYGHTKLAGEAAIMASGGLPFVLRTSWVFSATGNNFLRTMLRHGAQQSSLRIVADQIGAPTSAAYLAAATTALLAAGWQDGGWQQRAGLYHVSSAGATSWHGFAMAIFAAARRLGLPVAVTEVTPIPSAAYPQPARRPLNSRLDNGKFNDLGLVQQPQWEDSLATAMAEIAAAATPV